MTQNTFQGIRGIVDTNGKFRLIDEREKDEENVQRDSRKMRRGRVAETMKVDVLAEMFTHLTGADVEIPSSGAKARRELSDMIRAFLLEHDAVQVFERSEA